MNHILLVGGFPETPNQENIDLCQLLLREDVVEGVLKRDMTALIGVKNINAHQKLFFYLWQYSDGILALQACTRNLDTTTTTLSNHLTFLEQKNIVYRLPPSGLSGKQALKVRNKYYLVTQQDADFAVTR